MRRWHTSSLIGDNEFILNFTGAPDYARKRGTMTHDSPKLCPHCGQAISMPEPNASDVPNNRPGKTAETSAREYDHRGVALPRRTRMGGIITPQ